MVINKKILRKITINNMEIDSQIGLQAEYKIRLEIISQTKIETVSPMLPEIRSEVYSQVYSTYIRR